MGCASLYRWHLRNRVPVVNLSAETWMRALSESDLSVAAATSCLRRLSAAGALQHVKRGLYLVVDPAREVPAAAIASAATEPVAHYITTDAALEAHRLIDQPVTRITVVVEREGMRPFQLGGTLVRPVTMSTADFVAADAYPTTIEGYPIRLASRVQALADALARPRWALHFSLLSEVLAQLSPNEIERLASLALARSSAGAQRLGYLLEDAGRDIPPALASFRPSSVTSLVPGRRRPVFSTRWRLRG
jgi:predicted transcriptional regulator of viral defense system